MVKTLWEYSSKVNFTVKDSWIVTVIHFWITWIYLVSKVDHIFLLRHLPSQMGPNRNSCTSNMSEGDSSRDSDQNMRRQCRNFKNYSKLVPRDIKVRRDSGGLIIEQDPDGNFCFLLSVRLFILWTKPPPRSSQDSKTSKYTTSLEILGKR